MTKYNWVLSEVFTNNMKTLFGNSIKAVYLDVFDSESYKNDLNWQKEEFKISKYNSISFNGETIKIVFDNNQEMIIHNSEWGWIHKDNKNE